MSEKKPKSLAELCKKIQEFPTTAPYKVDKLEFAHSYIEEIKKWHRGLLEDLKQLQELYDKCECGHYHCACCRHYHGLRKGCSWKGDSGKETKE